MDELEIQKAIADGIQEGIKSAMASVPPVQTSGDIVVTKDPGDRPFRNLAEQARAVKAFEMSKGRNQHPRLNALKAIELDAMKASGAAEGVAADAGYLLEPTLVAEVLTPVHEEGPFTRSVRRLPVSANSNYGWINGVDESSRATGSRWGGVQSYWVEEAGTFAASKPKFRRINWELHKNVALAYGTDELLADVSLFSAVVNQAMREEIMFAVNDAVLNGNGVGKPLGVMNSPALVTVTRDTGATVNHADILAMWQRLHPRNRARSAWYINSEVEPKLDALYFSGTTSVLSPYVSYGPDGVMRIKGRPVIVTEFNAALNTTGDILLADMSDYLFWEKSNIEAATSIHVQFLTDETTFRFVYRCDGKPASDTPITPYKGTNTQGPYVVLGSAT